MSEQAVRVRARHRRQPRERFWHRVWRLYRFEIIWAMIVIAGLFLLIEQMSIRQTLRSWLQRSLAVLLSGASHMSTAVASFLDRVTASDILGYALIVIAMVTIGLRLRWRAMHSPRLTTLCCPQCGGNIRRKHRTTLDYLIALFVPVRRYCCVNKECHWQGLRVLPVQGVPRSIPTQGGDTD